MVENSPKAKSIWGAISSLRKFSGKAASVYQRIEDNVFHLRAM